MKFRKLNDHKLAQVLLVAPLSVIYHKHSTIKEALLEMNTSFKNSIEVEYVNDLFSLSTNEITDKRYEGKDIIVGFLLKMND